MLILAALIIVGYTNHAGNVVKGWPVKLTPTQVVLVERTLSTTNHQPPAINYLRTTSYSLLIFPRIRSAAHRGGLRRATRSGCRDMWARNTTQHQKLANVSQSAISAFRGTRENCKDMRHREDTAYSRRQAEHYICSAESDEKG